MTAKPLAWAAACFTVACFATGCANSGPPVETPVKRETAADQVLRISSGWTSTEVEKSLLSPPSEISVLTISRKSDVTLAHDSARESLLIEEEVETRSGATIRCQTQFEHPLGLRFGRKSGRAAVELVRPALVGQRRCDSPHPEPTISEPARRALFLLRSDQLVAVEPPLDDRIYRPQSL